MGDQTEEEETRTVELVLVELELIRFSCIPDREAFYRDYYSHSYDEKIKEYIWTFRVDDINAPPNYSPKNEVANLEILCPVCKKNITKINQRYNARSNLLSKLKKPCPECRGYQSGEPQTYTDYLQTPHWLAVRESAIRRAGFKCSLCGESSKDINLHVHHNSYEHVGAELPEDLCVLCSECHEKFHKKNAALIHYLTAMENLEQWVDGNLRWVKEVLDEEGIEWRSTGKSMSPSGRTSSSCD